MKYFHLIWKNVFRKKTRTVLTTGSIVLVLVLIVVPPGQPIRNGERVRIEGETAS